MTRIAEGFKRAGLILRSGHAEGADQAFELGAGSQTEIYLPWDGFNGLWSGSPGGGPLVYPEPSPAAHPIAESIHPAWDRCGRDARSMHARNVHQVLGQAVKEPIPSSDLVCWTPDGSIDGRGPNTGGTGQAIRVAVAYGIPVTNLARPDHREMVEDWLAETTSYIKT